MKTTDLKAKNTKGMTSTATLTLQVSNPYGIVCFEDLAAEMQKYFEIEKNAKNEAYHFILSHGHFKEFEDFCKNVKVDDHHAACVRILSDQINNE